MNSSIELVLSESEVSLFGKVLMGSMLFLDKKNLTVFLNGNLGMGKTTLTKALIQSCGFDGRVKSPTYTLVEPYELEGLKIFHFDLYRLADPEELEFIGGRDYFEGADELTEKQICIVEWSEKGLGFIPSPDVQVDITQVDRQRMYRLKAEDEFIDHLKVVWESESVVDQ